MMFITYISLPQDLNDLHSYGFARGDTKGL